MSKEKNTNAKLPKTGLLRGDHEPEYPFVHVMQDLLGHHIAKHLDPTKPDQAFVSEQHHDGSFSHKEVPSKGSTDYKGLMNSLVHEARNYVSGGSSSQSDGHNDSRTDATNRQNTKGDQGLSAVGDMMSGVAGQMMNMAKGAISHITPPGSGADAYSSYSGDHTTNYDGNHYVHAEEDHVTSCGGNMYTMITDGDMGVHVQSGSMDVRVENGKHQIFSGDVLTILSDTKIVFKVGSNSVELTPNGLTVTINSGEIMLKASGDITTQGSSTKIQGGGIPAPPTTFT